MKENELLNELRETYPLCRFRLSGDGDFKSAYGQYILLCVDCSLKEVTDEETGETFMTHFMRYSDNLPNTMVAIVSKYGYEPMMYDYNCYHFYNTGEEIK
jgi:hypothetical protein